MLIDCTHCQARVNAEVLKVEAYRDHDSYQLALLRCPECKHLLVGERPLVKAEEYDGFGNESESEEWGSGVAGLA